MITLITGAPGSGKSLLLVDEFLRKARDEGRKIIADGIPDLVIDHEPAQEVKDWTTEIEDQSSQTGKKTVYTFPEGSLVVVDECQRVFRPRKAGANVPPEVAAFETHRHQGLDFVLITQHPGLLDQNVRRLVGRHLHLRDVGVLGRYIYEWPEATDPERYKSALVRRKWSLPKDSFKLYKSASLHVKPVRGFPTALKVAVVAFCVLGGGGWYFYQNLKAKFEPATVPVPLQKEGVSSGVDYAVTPGQVKKDYDPWMDSLPRHGDFPESAPMYDQIRQVKVMPQVDGCIATKKTCKCYSQQATILSVSEDYCRMAVKSPQFNPYKEEKPVQVAQATKEPAKAEAPKAEVLEHTGKPLQLTEYKKTE